MMRRRTIWLTLALLLLGGSAMLIPGSPLQLANFFGKDGGSSAHPSLDPWLRALDSADSRERSQAISALGALGVKAEAAVPALADHMLNDADPEIRAAAAQALTKMAPVSRSAVSSLARALEDPYGAVRMHAALALSRLRTDARPAIPALIKALGDEDNLTNLDTFDYSIQEILAVALGRASAGDSAAVPALTSALQTAPTDEIRNAIVEALGEVGAPAQSAVSPIWALLHDPNPNLRRTAADALHKIQGRTVVVDSSAPAADELSLPEAERKYLWEIEHHGNLLVKHGFGALAQALKNGDAAALSRLLSRDFTGTELQQPHRVRADRDGMEVERLQDAGHPPAALSRDDFIARLLALRKLFQDKPPDVKLSLMALHPRQRGNLTGGWEGSALLRMHGEQTRGAPAEVMVVLRYQLAPPSEKSLRQPGWLQAAGIQEVHIARARNYLFAEVTRQRGLNVSKLHDNWKSLTLHNTPGGVYVCDFDRDGILDVLITDLGNATLYRGRPNGMFEDVTTPFGLGGRTLKNSVAAWVDIDGDGWDDLILGGRLYRNEMGKGFTDYTERSHLQLPIGNIIVADYDRDGKLDLYVTRSGKPGMRSWLDGKSNEAHGNYLFRNKGNWQFQDVTKISGAGGGRRSTFSAAWLDADNDGWPDLHVINEFGDGVLLINKHDGTFAEHALADKPADFGSMGLAVGDVNNDGNIDLFCANMYSKAGTRVIGNLADDAYPPTVMRKMRRFVAGSQLHLNRGGLKFDQVGQQMRVAAIGWSYGACLADLDNDGWLDLYATAGYVSRNRAEPDG